MVFVSNKYLKNIDDLSVNDKTGFNYFYITLDLTNVCYCLRSLITGTIAFAFLNYNISGIINCISFQSKISIILNKGIPHHYGQSSHQSGFFFEFRLYNTGVLLKP